MAASEAADHHWVLLVDNAKILKSIKSVLETSGVYDKQRLIHRMPEGSYAIPITGPVHGITGPIHDNPALSNCKLAKLQSPDLTKKAPCKRTMVLQNFLDGKISELPMVDNVSKTEFLRRISLIKMYQHSDMTIISNMNFDHPLWRQVCSFHPDIWADIGKCLKCKRLAVQSGVMSDDYRSPDIELVLGMDGWVEHIDNGIKYIFDVTKCMFCRGNITEKLRMASLSCKGETIVDLFAGIGYFTLPLLVHAGASCVHACEWNPAAIEGLKRGLIANKVDHKCIVHQGDNREVAPVGIADRVILGLIPSSEQGWVTACLCLRPDAGGWLHVHGNVTSKLDDDDDDGFNNVDGLELDYVKAHVSSKNADWSRWSISVATRIKAILMEHSSCNWFVLVRHIEHVKSYAPRIHHIVADIECRTL